MAGAGETKFGPKRPGKGKGSRKTQAGRRQKNGWMVYIWKGVKWQGWGDRGERERRAVNATICWGPGGAYLPVILHVVAQADEAGLEFLWP